MNKILITGYLGFLGRELVTCLNNNLLTKPEIIGIDKVSGYIDGVKSICCDLSKQYVKLRNIDTCYHIASDCGGILYNQKNVLNTNLDINQNTLDMCRKAGVKTFIYVSSLNVFEQVPGAFFEDFISTAYIPTNPYSLSKFLGEKLFKDQFLHYWIVRPSNIFGKSQLGGLIKYGESHVIADLLDKIEKAKEGECIEVWGDGTQVRNFIHVSDLCRILVSILYNSKGSDIINAGSQISMTIKEVAESLIKFKNKKLDIKFLPHYNKYERVDFSKFVPTVRDFKVNSLEEGLIV